MSLFSTLNTAVSGLGAQANYLGTIGDNIANSSTTGYKGASVDFETLLGQQATSDYQSGGVQSRVRYGIANQGNIVGTSSSTDLAINGSGFFMVQNAGGGTYLTRAGSFVPDTAGNLVNTAGFTLLGYSLANGTAASTLSPINFASQALSASPSTSGSLSPNLNSNSPIDTGDLPSANLPTSTYTSKTSINTYDNLGNTVTLDVYFTKTSANTWQADVYNQADATAGTFPYANPELGSQTLSFDPTTGKIAPGNPTSLNVTIPNGNPTGITFDLSNATQLATAYAPGTPSVNGSSPSSVSSVTIGKDGTVSAVYSNSVVKNLYQIPLGEVPAPNQLTSVSGNVYQVSAASGPLTISTANTGNLGAIDQSSIESSTVDIATELTNMITAQRSYEANSKVVTTSSELLQVLTNLK